ncbi:MAG: HEAT repeat domain-containing protein [Thermomicrobiales bacterium]|nr:HEAT repeat domain-containing protein [Thermomicrobiales bacterium]
MFHDRWLDLPAEARLMLARTMVDDAATAIEHQYSRALLAVLDDPDPDVRLAVLEGLSETTAPELLDYLLEHIETEDDARVRQLMALELGRLAFESVDDDRLDVIRDVLFRVFENDVALDVRRRALESLGYLEGEDIQEAIEDGYADFSIEMRSSALHAMGLQATQRWVDICLEELRSDEAELRFEALFALGSIGDLRTASDVIDAIEDEDAEVALAAIHALGEIGGQMAINRLRQLVDVENPAIAEAAEDALQEAQLTANPLRPLL